MFVLYGNCKIFIQVHLPPDPPMIISLWDITSNMLSLTRTLGTFEM